MTSICDKDGRTCLTTPICDWCQWKLEFEIWNYTMWRVCDFCDCWPLCYQKVSLCFPFLYIVLSYAKKDHIEILKLGWDYPFWFGIMQKITKVILYISPDSASCGLSKSWLDITHWDVAGCSSACLMYIPEDNYTINFLGHGIYASKETKCSNNCD